MSTETRKVLGQQSPGNTVTALYTVPGSTQTAGSSIVVTNTNTTQATFRISIAVAGAADATTQYIYYDVPINGNDTFVATIGFTLGAADVVRCKSSVANVNFTMFGVEIS